MGELPQKIGKILMMESAGHFAKPSAFEFKSGHGGGSCALGKGTNAVENIVGLMNLETSGVNDAGLVAEGIVGIGNGVGEARYGVAVFLSFGE